MTVFNIVLWKTGETPEWFEYAFGNPSKVVGHVLVRKKDGKMELTDILGEKYRYIVKHILPYFERKLCQHSETGNYPDKLFFIA